MMKGGKTCISFRYQRRITWQSKKYKEFAIQRLIDTCGNDVLRTSYMFLRDAWKADNAFLEVFIKVYNKFDSFNGGNSEKTWVIKIAINVCDEAVRIAG